MLIESSFDKLVFLNEKLLNISKILPNDFKLTVESIRDFTESIKYFIKSAILSNLTDQQFLKES